MDIEEIKTKLVSEVQSLLAGKLSSLQEEITRWKEMVDSSLAIVEHKAKISVDREIQRVIDARLAEIESRVQAAPAPLPAGGAAESDDASLLAALQAIDHGKSQIEILSTLMKTAHALAPRVLLLVAKGETLMGWSGQGLSRSDADIKRIAIPLSTPTSLKQVFESTDVFWGEASAHAGNAAIYAMLGAVYPREILITPLLLKGKVVAILYCDDGGNEGTLKKVDRIRILTWAASNVLDALPYRAKLTRPLPPATAETEVAPAAAAVPNLSLTHPGLRPVQVAPPPKIKDPGSITHPELTQRAIPAPAQEALSPEERKRHDDAKRLARVLVADLILYHRTEVEMGRKNNDLYKRLKQDIDRSREAYSERVGPEMAAKTSYLFEELVKTLADGHSEALAGY